MPQPLDEIRTAYDDAAEAYADGFLDELNRKPQDVELLKRFASLVGQGKTVLDIGCGPGHTTAHLSSLGLSPIGIDLSPGMIAKAKSLFPDIVFKTGNLLQLPHEDNSVEGILAFYCIVHLQSKQLAEAFNEIYRVLAYGGALLLSFHVGSEMVVAEDFLGSGAKLEFFPFPPDSIQTALLATGFTDLEILQRPPYDEEYPTDRCYIFAHKQNSD